MWIQRLTGFQAHTFHVDRVKMSSRTFHVLHSQVSEREIPGAVQVPRLVQRVRLKPRGTDQFLIVLFFKKKKILIVFPTWVQKVQDRC